MAESFVWKSEKQDIKELLEKIESIKQKFDRELDHQMKEVLVKNHR